MNRDGLKLAELGGGESFGEEALISDAKRNATITMGRDGALGRLGKDDFEELLRPYGIAELARTGRVALPKIDSTTSRLRPARTA